ncbi:MAG: HAD-IA family hydrolase [Thermoleophilia bacterium]
MSGFEPVIFDLDGTVVDTVQLIRDSFRFATRTVLGVELADGQIMAGVGRPLMAQMIALSPDHAQELYDAYREYNHRFHDELIRPYAGMRTALEQLRAGGRHLGIVTSKSADTTEMAFRAVGIGQLFDIIVTASDSGEHKPSPVPVRLCLERFADAGLPADPTAAIYIGDSPFDIAAGAAAGTTTAAVTWGVFGLDELLAAHPDFVVDRPRDLVELCLGGSVRGEPRR